MWTSPLSRHAHLGPPHTAVHFVPRTKVSTVWSTWDLKPCGHSAHQAAHVPCSARKKHLFVTGCLFHSYKGTPHAGNSPEPRPTFVPFNFWPLKARPFYMSGNTVLLAILDLGSSHVEPHTNQVSGFLLYFLWLEQWEEPHLPHLLGAIVRHCQKFNRISFFNMSRDVCIEPACIY